MGTHPIFESDFDCLLALYRMCQAVARRITPHVKYSITLKRWPCTTKLIKTYDTEENKILGHDRSFYLFCEQKFPQTFKTIFIKRMYLTKQKQQSWSTGELARLNP